MTMITELTCSVSVDPESEHSSVTDVINRQARADVP